VLGEVVMPGDRMGLCAMLCRLVIRMSLQLGDSGRDDLRGGDRAASQTRDEPGFHQLQPGPDSVTPAHWRVSLSEWTPAGPDVLDLPARNRSLAIGTPGSRAVR
jgi:hypothetical protein